MYGNPLITWKRSNIDTFLVPKMRSPIRFQERPINVTCIHSPQTLVGGATNASHTRQVGSDTTDVMYKDQVLRLSCPDPRVLPREKEGF